VPPMITIRSICLYAPLWKTIYLATLYTQARS